MARKWDQKRAVVPSAPPPAVVPESVAGPTVETRPDGADLGVVVAGFAPPRGDEVTLPAPPAPPAPPPPRAAPAVRAWRVLECAVRYDATDGRERRAEVGALVTDMELSDALDLQRRGYLEEA